MSWIGFPGNACADEVFILNAMQATLEKKYSRAKNQYVRMISDRSHDTEDWSDDAENSALHHKNKLHNTIFSNRKTVILNVYNISNYNYLLLCYWSNKQPWSAYETSFKNSSSFDDFAINAHFS